MALQSQKAELTTCQSHPVLARFGYWEDKISSRSFLPAPCMSNSALGIFSHVNLKAEFGLKIPQVWFEEM